MTTKASPPIDTLFTLTTVLPGLNSRLTSLKDLVTGTTCSTPGRPARFSSPMVRSSPMTPMIVCSGPFEGWGVSPKLSMDLMTAPISDTEASFFITTSIMVFLFLRVPRHAGRSPI